MACNVYRVGNEVREQITDKRDKDFVMNLPKTKKTI